MNPDKMGEAAFSRYEELLALARKGSPLKGAELRAARKAYSRYLLELQPHGQHMLDRAVATTRQVFNALKGRLECEGFEVWKSDDLWGRKWVRFDAGMIQLNEDISIHIAQKEVGLTLEIRLRTRKVSASYLSAFSKVPIDLPRKVEAEDYDGLAKAIVADVLRALPLPGEFATAA